MDWDDVILFRPQEKNVISIRLDKDILAFFREDGDGYQARINAVLKSFVAYQRKKEEKEGGQFQTYEVFGGARVSGSIKISGSSLATTYAMCASLLTDEPVVLNNTPNVSCLKKLSKLFESISVNYSENIRQGTRGIHSKELENEIALGESSKEYFSGSILTMVSLLASGKTVNFSSDIKEFTDLQFFSNFVEISHLFGIKERLSFGAFTFTPPSRLKANEIDLLNYKETPHSTLTATSLLFAVLADGETIIKNGSYSPTIIDLCEFLKKIGAKIEGVGSSLLKIKGVKRLKGTDYSMAPDYLEAYLYITIAVATRGYLKLTNVDLDCLEPFLYFLSDFGVKVERKIDSVEIDAMSEPLKLPKTEFKVGGYPNFPAYNALLLGVFLSTFDEPTTIEGFIYLSPWVTLNELNKFGIKMSIDRERKKMLIKPSVITNAPTDLKSNSYNASILLATILAKGKSPIKNGNRLGMFYEKIEEKLKNCGISMTEVIKEKQNKEKK